jgi:hypothetical protein
MLKFSGLLAAGIFICACNSLSQVSNVTSDVSSQSNQNANTERKIVKTCSVDLEEQLRAFYAPSPGEFRDVEKDKLFVNALKECPHEELIKSITTLRALNPKDYEIRVKTTYLLIVLDHDIKKNGEELISMYSSYADEENGTLGIDRVVDMICDVILERDLDKTLISKSFDLRPNGAMGTMLYDTYLAMFMENPGAFLRPLKDKSKRIRENTYDNLCFAASGNNILIKRISAIQESSEIQPISREMLQFIKQSKTCEDAAKSYNPLNQ